MNPIEEMIRQDRINDDQIEKLKQSGMSHIEAVRMVCPERILEGTTPSGKVLEFDRNCFEVSGIECSHGDVYSDIPGGYVVAFSKEDLEIVNQFLNSEEE